MIGKRFRVRFEQEDGRGEIVNEKGVELTAREVVDLLNAMSEEIEEVGISIKLFEDDVQIKDKKIEEQQDIIEAKDSLLSILSEENEKLRKELDDCEKFRYSVFKRMRELL